MNSLKLAQLLGQPCNFHACGQPLICHGKKRGEEEGGWAGAMAMAMTRPQVFVSPDVLQLAGRIIVRPGQIEAAVQRVLSIRPGDVGPRYSVCRPRMRPRHWHAFVDLVPVAAFVDPHERTEARVPISVVRRASKQKRCAPRPPAPRTETETKENRTGRCQQCTLTPRRSRSCPSILAIGRRVIKCRSQYKYAQK